LNDSLTPEVGWREMIRRSSTRGMVPSTSLIPSKDVTFAMSSSNFDRICEKTMHQRAGNEMILLGLLISRII